MTEITPTRKKPVIGLIGGIGAGKSTVAAEFARLGCKVIDADQIGHALLATEPVRQALRRLWGEAIFTPEATVDRAALAKLVFADGASLTALNAILHPRIGAEIARQIDEAQADASVRAAVLDAAVMLEAGWDKYCTHKVYVDATGEQRYSRVHSQRGWAEAAWRSRENSQISLYKKSGKCEYKIDNSLSISCLRDQVLGIYNQIVHPEDLSETKR